MVIGTDVTLALYCPRCGKLYKHDVSRFKLKYSDRWNLVCSCGQVQATLSKCRRQYFLNIPCIVCQTSHIICLDGKRMWHTAIDKLYCVQKNLELGFIGQKRNIEETVANHIREFHSLVQELDSEEYDEYIKNPVVMLEVLNRIHDIAEKGGIYCGCGSTNIYVTFLPDGIELGCIKCGGRKIIPAQNEQDICCLATVSAIELMPGRQSCRKQ